MLTGHKTRSVFERYNIVSAGDLTDAADRLRGLTGTVRGQARAFHAHAEAKVSEVLSKNGGAARI